MDIDKPDISHRLQEAGLSAEAAAAVAQAMQDVVDGELTIPDKAHELGGSDGFSQYRRAVQTQLREFQRDTLEKLDSRMMQLKRDLILKIAFIQFVAIGTLIFTLLS